MAYPESESGTALLITLIALSMISILGLYVALNAATGIQISDNFESHVQATYAAVAGLNHARELIRGLELNAVLIGPDGAFNSDPGYARSFGFRNPLPLQSALSLDILDPLSGLPWQPDDGLISTGFVDGRNGTPLISREGAALTRGTAVLSRYFVKIVDNNGNPSEIARDPSDSPSVDGDGIVIVRSVGVARTLAGAAGPVRRLNSVAVFESRLKRVATFDIGPAIVIAGNEVDAELDGSYTVNGNLHPGIGTVDVDPADSISPSAIIMAAAGEQGRISGGDHPSPSVADVSAGVNADPDRRLMLDPDYLWDFVQRKAPSIADTVLQGNQSWVGGSAPPLGTYDTGRPWNAPGQDPRITVVNGDLHVTGGMTGGGILVVSGDFSCQGPCRYSGLVLVIGSGNLDVSGPGSLIEGEVIVANLVGSGPNISFGTPGFYISGDCRFVSNGEAVRMALGLIPATQVSFREIAGTDP